MNESVAAIVRVASSAAAEDVAGRTVIERVVRSALEAGARPCIVLAFEPPPERVLKIPGVRWTREEATARDWAGDVFLLVEADALYDPRLLRWVMASSPEPGRARTIRLEGRPLLSKVHVGERGRDLALSSAERVPETWLHPVRTVFDREWAELWLFQRLRKPDEGLMSRLIEVPLSTAATRLLWRLPLYPHMMTAASFGVGLWGARELALGSWMRQVVGAAFVLIHSVLDGCDAQLARLKLDESALAALLRFWEDKLVLAAVLSALGWGLARAGAPGRPFELGLAAAAFVLASGAVVAGRGARGDGNDEEAPSMREVREIMDYASRGGFIYLILPAALFAKLLWFIWAAAAGGAVYFSGLLWLRRMRSAPRA
jgi:1L-myo-inositol 1-phosphate cytidylyltransferase / CDP-L-myo-inositol myo-inositolphosphotransferase